LASTCAGQTSLHDASQVDLAGKHSLTQTAVDYDVLFVQRNIVWGDFMRMGVTR
jgi:hypothetical protein